MMGAMSGLIIWWSLLSISLLLGFAYIIWILASKEAGSTKLVGQIIAVVIAVMVLILFTYGGIYGRNMSNCGQNGMMPMMGKGMNESSKEMMRNQMMQHKSMGERMMLQQRMRGK